MTNPLRHIHLPFRISLRTAVLTLVAVVFIPAAQAQPFIVLHDFTAGQDGATPYAGLTMDKAGNLYGTASSGGIASDGYGTVYRLKRSGSNWIFNPLYSFLGGGDGANPRARVVFGPDGVLYGTTTEGGGGECIGRCGTIFNLRPPPSACKSALCPWTETLLYTFFLQPSGAGPGYGDLIFDQEANIYGTTFRGGSYGYGLVYEMMPSGGSWTESALYAFAGSDGELPYHGVILDSAGNLYGTTIGGGSNGFGAVFQLTPSASGWTENILYNFQGESDGSYPYAGLIFDQSGNLYGATITGGQGGGGTVFELSPAGGSWTYSLVYSLAGGSRCGPLGTLVMDGAGNLYGTTYCGGANKLGNVFKLTPSGGGWTYTSLQDFRGGNDGEYPYSNVILDANGNLYGTASAGGSNGLGIVWEIMP